MKNPTITLTSDNGDVFIESSDYKVVTRSSTSDEARVEQMKDALESVSIVGNEFEKVITKLNRQPKEIELELGLKFSIESGVIIAKTSAEATFKVNIKWCKD